MTAKILVVDDEPLIEYVIQQQFRHEIGNKQLEFYFVSNGVQALEKLQASESFDLVLTDINMTEMDGLTLLERLPAIDPTLKAIVVSAYGDMENIKIAMNRGAFDFITKPIDLEDLKTTINKTIKFVQQFREQQHQLEAAQKQLRYQAFNDPLTGLPNRCFLLEQIHQGINANYACKSNLEAVLFLALKRYQIVKYSLGHSRGELLLVEVARRLEACTASGNLVARVGEDSFAIWLADIPDSQYALNIAERIYQVLEMPFNLNGTAVFCSVSIGIVFNTNRCEQPENLLRAADLAMHDARLRGTAGAVVFDIDMQKRAVAQFELETNLEKAIKLQQLHLNYQPIVSLSTNQLVGFEALVRWQHTHQRWVSPAEFIPIAERTGLILPLGQWVLSEAIRCLSRWRKQFPDSSSLSVSVNLSGLQLFDPDLITHLDSLLQANSLSGEFLKFEITESVLMENASLAATVLEQFKARGIQLCLDDFGTGYSNLLYLQRLPIDILKIDRSFISCMQDSTKDFALVKAIVNLAHSLGLETTAEGVETSKQYALLQALGCQYGQGYFFSKPLPPDDAVNLIIRNKAVGISRWT